MSDFDFAGLLSVILAWVVDSEPWVKGTLAFATAWTGIRGLPRTMRDVLGIVGWCLGARRKLKGEPPPKPEYTVEWQTPWTRLRGWWNKPTKRELAIMSAMRQEFYGTNPPTDQPQLDGGLARGR